MNTNNENIQSPVYVSCLHYAIIVKIVATLTDEGWDKLTVVTDDILKTYSSQLKICFPFGCYPGDFQRYIYSPPFHQISMRPEWSIISIIGQWRDQ